jgi:hypothetical protein
VKIYSGAERHKTWGCAPDPGAPLRSGQFRERRSGYEPGEDSLPVGLTSARLSWGLYLAAMAQSIARLRTQRGFYSILQQLAANGDDEAQALLEERERNPPLFLEPTKPRGRQARAS